MSTPKKKLEGLRKYFLDGGSTDAADVATFLDTEEIAVEGIVAELKKAYPADFGGVEEPEYRFYLKNDDKTLTELEQFKEKSNEIFFIKKEPKELVDIILKGEPITVDLVKLRKLGASPVNGVQAAVVVQIAELAKA